jgi:ribosomal-protein-alanine N-acetyltransferase
MTPSHKATLISAGIEKEKLFLLSDKGISDPFGQDLSAYRKCRDEIFSSIDEIFKNEMPKAEYLTEKDAEEIAFIEKECFADPWSVKSILDSMKGNNVFIGIKENGNLIGYLSLYESLDEGYINNIAVLKDKRRKGIGIALLKEITHYAVSKGLSFISLEVRVSNTPAINLYSSFGFKEEGKRKNYYNNPTEDAIILTRRF